MSKTVLVTGAGGFIGLNVAEEFANFGWRVIALVHHNIPEKLKALQNIKIIQGDVTSQDFMKQFEGKVDVLAHVAGLAADIGEEKKFIELN